MTTLATVDESVPLKASQLTNVLVANLRAGHPVCVSGAPGTGKTDLIGESVRKAFAVNDGRIIAPPVSELMTTFPGVDADYLILYPVTFEPTDIRGLPIVTINGAEFSVYGDIALLYTAKRPLVVFFDDFGHALQSVQGALMQLLLARGMNGRQISPHVRFVAATNRRTDKGSGVTAMLEPVKSRFLMLEFKPDVDEWQDWAAANKVRHEVIAYLSLEKGAFLGQVQTVGSMAQIPNPRNWYRVHQQMLLNHSPDVWQSVFAGCVGKEYGVGFAGFLNVYSNMVMPESVWANPDTAQIPTEPSSLWALCSALANKVTPATIGAYTRYLKRLVPPVGHKKEFAMLSVKMMCARDPSLQESKDWIDAATGPLGQLMMRGK